VLPLLGFLRGLGVITPPPPVVVPTDPVGLLLEGFGAYLASERGLAKGTIRFYVHIAGRFAAERLEADGLDLAAVRAVDVTGFTTRVCAGRGLSSTRQVVSALRALLRYLQLEGRIDLALDLAVLSAAGSDPSLPRGITATAVARLLASCDRRTAAGRRDYAILLEPRRGARSDITSTDVRGCCAAAAC
jgi:site-specific recombinase XerD